MADATDKSGINYLADEALAPVADVPLSTSTTISALALNFAMKYHESTIIKDGTLYQQFKMEGRNIEVLAFEDVFVTAAKVEAWLLNGPNRHAALLREGIVDQTMNLITSMVGDAIGALADLAADTEDDDEKGEDQ